MNLRDSAAPQSSWKSLKSIVSQIPVLKLTTHLNNEGMCKTHRLPSHFKERDTVSSPSALRFLKFSFRTYSAGMSDVAVKYAKMAATFVLRSPEFMEDEQGLVCLVTMTMKAFIFYWPS